MAAKLEKCSICLDLVEQAIRARLLPSKKQATSCNHGFHFECVTDWTLIHDKNTCPTCRQVSSAVEHKMRVVNGVVESSEKVPIGPSEPEASRWDELWESSDDYSSQQEIAPHPLAFLGPFPSNVSLDYARRELHRLLGPDEESEIGDTQTVDEAEMYDSGHEESDDEELPLPISTEGNTDDLIIIEDDDEDVIYIAQVYVCASSGGRVIFN